jgi:hypothetical protein
MSLLRSAWTIRLAASPLGLGGVVALEVDGGAAEVGHFGRRKRRVFVRWKADACQSGVCRLYRLFRYVT